jgi:DNA-binding NarL/FixJ family response regulator
MREGVRQLLAAERDFAVVGEAATGREALALAAARRPDLVLCDVHLPDLAGPDVARALARLIPAPVVVMLTMYADDAQRRRAWAAGAAGYLTKDLGGAALLDGLRRALRGEPPTEAITPTTRGPEPPPGSTNPLTPRETEVLAQAAAGRINKEIAGALGISDQTVKNHVTAILRKLEVGDRTQAVLLALRRGWIGLGPPTAGPGTGRGGHAGAGRQENERGRAS